MIERFRVRNRQQVQQETTPTLVHVGIMGEQPGGMAQVVNEYLTWQFEDVQITGMLTTTGRHDPKALFRSIACAYKLLIARCGKNPVAAVFHLSQRGSFVREGMLLWWASRLGIPTAAQIHGSQFVEFSHAYPQIVKLCLQNANKVYTLTDRTSRAVEILFDDNTGPVIVKVRNAVALPPDPRSTQSRKIVMAGLLGRRKGVDVLLAAWTKLAHVYPDWELDLVGPRSSDIAEWPTMPGLNYIGAEAHHDLMARIDDSEIAVLVARDEALPMFLLEAMARSCAVVTTSVGQIPELVTPECGRIVRVGDIAETAEAIKELICDEPMRRKQGAECRSRIAKAYSSEAVRPILHSEWVSLLKIGGSNASKSAETHSDISGAASIVTERRP